MIGKRDGADGARQSIPDWDRGQTVRIDIDGTTLRLEMGAKIGEIGPIGRFTACKAELDHAVRAGTMITNHLIGEQLSLIEGWKGIGARPKMGVAIATCEITAVADVPVHDDDGTVLAAFRIYLHG